MPLKHDGCDVTMGLMHGAPQLGLHYAETRQPLVRRKKQLHPLSGATVARRARSCWEPGGGSLSNELNVNVLELFYQNLKFPGENLIITR